MNNFIEISFILLILSAILTRFSLFGRMRFFIYVSLCFTFIAAVVSVISLQNLQLVDPWLGKYHCLMNLIQTEMYNIELGFKYDALSMIGVFCVSVLCFLSCLYSVKYLKSCKEFIAYSNGFAASMIMLIASNNLIQIYIGLELITFFSYLLINYYYKSINDVKNIAFKVFTIQKFGDIFFICAAFLVEYYCGSFDIQRINSFSIYGINGHDIVFLMILVSVAIKSSQIGFTWWLQDAMVAPTPASAFLHAATLVSSGMFIICRLLSVLSISSSIVYISTFYFLFSSFYSALLALKEYNLKKILAYSTSSKIGLLLAICMLGSIEHALVYFSVHAFSKFALFICVGNISYALSHEQDIRNMGGLIVNLPKTYILTVIASLMFIGVVPNIISHSAFHESNILVNIFVYCISFITSIYIIRIIANVFHGEHRVAERSSAYISENNNLLTFVLIVCIITNLIFRVFIFGKLNPSIRDTTLEYCMDIFLFIICILAYKHINFKHIKIAMPIKLYIDFNTYIDKLRKRFFAAENTLENTTYCKTYYMLVRSGCFLLTNMRLESYRLIIGCLFVVVLLLNLIGVL